MDEQRQTTFQKFRSQQAAVRDVLRATEAQHHVLSELGSQNQLDGKLAEYAFFPLSHVLKESQRLSSACLQVVVQTVRILVSQGWRANLPPAMGQQLLVLMTLLASDESRQSMELPTDELKCAAFGCVTVLIRSMAQAAAGRALFQDQSKRNIVDQLAYMLLESLADATADTVQIAAANALLELNASIDNRILLASLLPRTVSSLTKALKPSTQARRTRKVLIVDLKLLGAVLTKVLADSVAVTDTHDQDVLDVDWLKATTAQVKNALVQVCKLRTYGDADVRDALFEFGITLMEECSTTLKDSHSILVETLVMLSGSCQNNLMLSRLWSLLSLSPGLVEQLRLTFHDWSQALPRIMQGSDDRPKELMIMKITNLFDILSKLHLPSDNLNSILGPTILKSVTNAVEVSQHKPIQPYDPGSEQYMSLLRHDPHPNTTFDPILFNHQSQKESARSLLALVHDLSRRPGADGVARSVIDSINDFDDSQRTAPIWLAIQLLRLEPSNGLDWTDMLDLSSLEDDKHTSRIYLVQDLYFQCKDILLETSSQESSQEKDPRLFALVLESICLQAHQLGHSYRSELYETLYPVLALLSHRDTMLQRHAVTALNSLAASCGYTSVSVLLVENVDYLVNSIAWKLNTFNLSSEAPAVLNMLIRLVGAKVIPFLDDLIASIFAALDSFHGYPEWVEMLFQVLKAMVDESVKHPQLAITDGRQEPQHQKVHIQVSTVDAIVRGLQARKRRKLDSDDSYVISDREVAPRRPWTKAQDDPNYRADPTDGKDIETLLREAEIADQENDLPAPKAPDDEDLTKPLSKSHELLLKIAQSTAPHLSNPSFRVRQTLLQLLKQISPLLARHENTFLPFINDVWPAVVQRLFADVATSISVADEGGVHGETAYNVATAAEVVAGFCTGAGDFMTTRIEQIFSQLKMMYEKTWKEVETSMNRAKNQRDGHGSAIEDAEGRYIRGAVNLQVIQCDGSSSSPAAAVSLGPSLLTGVMSTTLSRTSTGQVFSSLVRLFVAVLQHVRLHADRADEVFDMLTPLLDRPGDLGASVSEALVKYNADAVWLLRCRKVIDDEISRGVRTAGDRVWKELAVPEINARLLGETPEHELQPVCF